MPDARERKGSIVSARPSGLNIRQWCFAMTVWRLGSVWERCVQACSSRLPEVVFGPVDGRDGVVVVSLSLMCCT